jgi:hypothetical protein
MVEEMRRHMAPSQLRIRVAMGAETRPGVPNQIRLLRRGDISAPRTAFLSALDQIVDLLHLHRDYLTTGEFRAARLRALEA